jgi:hypothetical protein
MNSRKLGRLIYADGKLLTHRNDCVEVTHEPKTA